MSDNIADIVIKFLKDRRGGELPKDTDYTLDLINHAKRYRQALIYKELMGVKMMRRLGFKTPEEVKDEPL